MPTFRIHAARTTFIALACLCFNACGDDDSDDSKPDAGTSSDSVETAGSGGRAGRGGAGGGAGRAGGGAGRPAAGGGMNNGGAMMALMCTEPAPNAPVVCGGQTCEPPTQYGMNQCVYPCCATVDGSEVCGAKSTAAMFPTGCEPPVAPDMACPDLEAMGMPFPGCCNLALGKCGFVSPVRPGCITMSQAVTLPDPLQACGAPPEMPDDNADAGTQ